MAARQLNEKGQRRRVSNPPGGPVESSSNDLAACAAETAVDA